MSASMRPTRWPCICRARARFAATVDLPTPPLPLAMAMMWRTPSRAGLAVGPGCMKDLNLARRAEPAEQFDRVDAGVVAVVPDNLVRVVPPGDHLRRLRGAGLNFLVADQPERVGRLLPLLVARGARARLAQRSPGDERPRPVVPVDGQAVPLAAQGGRLQL